METSVRESLELIPEEANANTFGTQDGQQNIFEQKFAENSLTRDEVPPMMGAADQVVGEPKRETTPIKKQTANVDLKSDGLSGTIGTEPVNINVMSSQFAHDSTRH